MTSIRHNICNIIRTHDRIANVDRTQSNLPSLWLVQRFVFGLRLYSPASPGAELFCSSAELKRPDPSRCGSRQTGPSSMSPPRETASNEPDGLGAGSTAQHQGRESDPDLIVRSRFTQAASEMQGSTPGAADDQRSLGTPVERATLGWLPAMKGKFTC